MRIIALIVASAALFAADNPPSQKPADQQPVTQKPADQKAKSLAQQRADAAAARQRLVKQAADRAAAEKAAQPAAAIPAAATLVEPNLYRHTDAQGKTWLYRSTPFGVSRWEDKPVSPPSGPALVSPSAAALPRDPVSVTDRGDKIEFERKTPFGTTKWVKNKADLTSDEKALVASQPAATPPQNKAVEAK